MQSDTVHTLYCIDIPADPQHLAKLTPAVRERIQRSRAEAAMKRAKERMERAAQTTTDRVS